MCKIDIHTLILFPGSALEVPSEKQPKHPIKPEVRTDDQPLVKSSVSHSILSSFLNNILKAKWNSFRLS